MEQLTQLRGAWTGMPRRAQLAILGVAIATVFIMFFVLRAATSTQWTPVAQDLSTEKVGQAQNVLEEAGFQARAGETGSTVEVPKEDASKAAAALMTAGIAAKGSRADCVKQFSEGSSVIAGTSAETAIKVEGCRESQAANDIEQIEGVKHATVDVSLPARSLFESEEEPAKASVFVDTDGEALPTATVRGIQRSVAARFDKLKVENVVVTDDTGRVVSPDQESDARDAETHKLKTEADYNAEIERKLTEQYEKIVGAGNVVITSNVELDMDQIQREIQDVGGADNAQGPADSETHKKELLDRSTPNAVEGVAGTGSQGIDTDNRTTETDTTTTAGTAPSYLQDEGATTYANDKVAELIDVAPGSVNRFRMSVVVDDGVDPAAANAVKNGILSWMGGNSQDSFSFDQAPIAASGQTEAKTSSAASTIAGYVKWVLLGFGLIGLAFVLRRSLTQRTAELLAPADDLLLLEPGEFTPIPIAELEAALAAGQPDPARQGRRELQRRVEQIADAKPQDVANELRRWMHQDEQTYGRRG